MLMVILGAGASYDSAQAYRPVYPGGGGGSQNFGVSAPRPDDGGPWRPPLTNDLFLDRHHARGEIVARYPKLAHILPRLREPSNGRSVEQMLESLQEEGKNNPVRQREIASVRFYLCELLYKVTQEWGQQTNGVTNYAPLVGDILQFNKPGERVCLVTFNYDLLLERALYTFGFKSRDPEGYLDSHPILKLFKLHGSVEWSRIADLPKGLRLQPQALIEDVNTIQLTDKFVRAIATDPGQMHDFGRPIFPAIAIPVQTKSKDDFECPPTHLNYLAEMLPHVTKILIIGWQAKEAHFLKMLRSNLPKLGHVMVVGENASDSERIRKYFLDEIKLDLPNSGGSTSFLIDRENASDSEETRQHFVDEVKLDLPNPFVGQGGFTNFIVNQEGRSFFEK
jgi:hypothetical protein